MWRKVFGLFPHLREEFLPVALSPCGSEFAAESTVEKDPDFSGLPLRPRQQGASANPGMKVLERT